MLFSSSIFIFIFLPLVIFVYYVILRGFRTLQNVFLTLVSLLFYAWGEPKFVVILIISICFNWFFALLVDKFRVSIVSKFIIALMVMFNISIIFIFKYLVFVLTNVSKFTGPIHIPDIALPIGISFFTFQAISYVIDVYRKNGDVQKNPLNVALYIAFFPQLIAGPIVRYKTISEQIKGRRESLDDFTAGICRFIIGLSKKMLLANTLGFVADQAFASDELSVCYAWIGALAYTFQIFFDFSGYSDMAIGLGRMFGFHFLENFNYPYISKSITEFWRRWHISLGSWFRDYVYFPLGGSHVKSNVRLTFNLFVVWSLTGIWHGANWTFITWGLMYFVLISLEKLTGFIRHIGFWGHIYTLFFVVMGWVIFRAETISEAFTYIKKMFGIGAAGFYNDIAGFYFIDNIFYFILAFILSIPIVELISSKIKRNKVTEIIYVVLMSLLIILVLSFVVKDAYNPFIYFNF